MPAATCSVGGPLDLLREAHGRIEHYLGVLQRTARDNRGGTLDSREAQAFETALRFFRFVVPQHTADEEDSLFPRLRRVRTPEMNRLARRIETLEEEHGCAERSHSEVDRLGAMWLAGKRLQPEQVSRLIALLEGLGQLYRHHIQFEESEVFPLAVTALSASDLETLGTEIAARHR